MSVFTPKLMLHRVTEISPELLNQYGIHGLILDIDNTLTHHDSQKIGQDVLDWLSLMRKNQIMMTIVSNNTVQRVQPFAQKLGLDFVANGAKPLPVGMNRALKRLHLRRDEVAVIGDQIYTDMIGGNMAGLMTILVEPFEIEKGKLLRFKRKMEPIHLRHYKTLQKRGKRP